jgi:hypothetical protein
MIKKGIKVDKNVISKNVINKNDINKNIETTSFLRSVESSEIDVTSLIGDIKDKQFDEIVSKYLDIKKQINLFWNKIN